MFQGREQEESGAMSDLNIGGTPLAKLKVVELRAELESRSLETKGRKDELVARLASYMEVRLPQTTSWPPDDTSIAPAKFLPLSPSEKP